MAIVTYSVAAQPATPTVTFPNFDPCKCIPKDADPSAELELRVGPERSGAWVDGTLGSGVTGTERSGVDT